MTVQKQSENTRGSVWPLIGGAILVLAGYCIPVPGVQEESLRTFGPGFSELAISIGSSIPWLVSVHLLLLATGWHRRKLMLRVAAAVYLLGALGQGAGIALYLESLNSNALYGAIVVPNPGWAFVIQFSLAWAAGAAVTWFVAWAITRTGRANGALFLLLVWITVGLVLRAQTMGATIGLGGSTSFLFFLWALSPVAMVALSAVMFRRPMADWPVKLVRLPLASSWDVLALLGLAHWASSGLGLLLFYASPGWVAWITGLESLPVVVLAVLLCVWWYRRVTPSPATRPWGPLAFSILTLVAVVCTSTVFFVTSGAADRAFAPGPLEGEASFTVTLAAVDSFEPQDKDAMVQRLQALGASAEVSAADDQEITLRIENALSQDAVLDALRPNFVSLHIVEDIAALGNTLAFGPPAELERYHEAPSLTGDCATLIERQARLPDDANCLYRIQENEAFDDAPPTCFLHCLAPEVVITSRDITDASVGNDSQTQRPVVQMELSAGAADRFGDATEANVMHRLAIVQDQELISAPRINERIGGGRFQITLGNDQGHEQMLREAQLLVESLKPDHVFHSQWTLVTE